MGKVTVRQLPPDHPIFREGPTIFVPFRPPRREAPIEPPKPKESEDPDDESVRTGREPARRRDD
jgi:hypothetical protein